MQNAVAPKASSETLALPSIEMGNLRPLLGIECIVLDLDDTLIDTFTTGLEALSRCADALSLPRPDESYYRETYGRSFSELVWRSFPDSDVSARHCRELYEREGLVSPAPPLFDVNIFLNAMRTQGLKIVLWTDSNDERTEAKMGGARIDRTLFDAVVTRDSKGGGLKPDPDAILAALSRIGCPNPASALMVGNGRGDQRAARECGMHFCAVGRLERWEALLEPASYYRASALSVLELVGGKSPHRV